MANFHCRTGVWQFGLWDDIATADNCIAVIDEAQLWFGSRNWQQTLQEDLGVFQQSRKMGVGLIWCAQHEKRVDTALRELTETIWRHHRFRIGRNRWVMARAFDPDEPKKCIGRRVIKVDAALCRHYFTEEVIGQRDGRGYSFGVAAAYRRGAADGAAPELADVYRLRPNIYRVEWPNGRVAWVTSEDDSRLRTDVMDAYDAWARVGRPKALDQVAIGFYRSEDGHLMAIDGASGELIPLELQKSAMREALEAFTSDASLAGRELGRAVADRWEKLTGRTVPHKLAVIEGGACEARSKAGPRVSPSPKVLSFRKVAK